MKANMTRWASLGFLLATSILSLSAQAPAPAQARGGGRGAPPVLSTTPYDIWPIEQLSKPGSLGNYGSHNSSIQRRDVGAAPETHTGFSHFLMFTSGQGTFTLGGEIVDGPDGKKIVKGGNTHPIVIGQMYHIPINTVHWAVPNPGTSVTYWVTNINIVAP